MRILYLITRGEPGGAQVHVLELLRGFRGRFDLALGLGEGGFLAEEAGRLGVPVRVLPSLVQPVNPLADARALREIGAFVLASRYEGLPLTVLEAMRAGLPVVATDAGGVGEAVRDGETGFLVASPARDPERAVAELADRLDRLLADPALRARLGAAGRRAYEARFTLEPMLRSLEQVYAEAAAR